MKLRVPEELKASRASSAPQSRAAAAASSAASAANLVYAYRLKGSAKVNAVLKREGLPDIRAGGRRLVASASAPAPAPPLPAPAPLQ